MTQRGRPSRKMLEAGEKMCHDRRERRRDRLRGGGRERGREGGE